MIPQDKLQQLFPVVLWVAFLLTGCGYIEKSCAADTQDRALDALLLFRTAPWVIFVSKVTAVTVIVLTSATITAGCCAVLLNVAVWGELGGLLLIFGLVSFGYSAVAILLASVASNSRLRGGLLPLIVIPMLFPLLIGAVETTQDLLIGRLSWDSPWIALIVACDVVYFVTGINLYEYAITS
jgi:heme exporter protein B